jgi:choline dehydrogenase-like flavoprotein
VSRARERESMSEFDHDVVVIGSGFGGSVAALRLT